MSGWAGVREPLACVGFWFAHEIVGYIIPDLEKELVIVSMYHTTRNEEPSLVQVGNAAPMSANFRYEHLPAFSDVLLAYTTATYESGAKSRSI